ncbi:MAG: hypothetical protein P1V19_23575, partial [Gimesia sp.]|nr:hypothetical protein [Gimesia sp.]
ELITRSFTVNYLGPKTAAALLPALMKIILDGPDQCEFIPENTIQLLSRTGTFESYTALELLQSSINRVIEEDVFLPEILAPAVDQLDQQINDMYQQMGFRTKLEQEYLERYQTMKSLLTDQQTNVVRFFLMYLTASELPDDFREAAVNSLLFW